MGHRWAVVAVALGGAVGAADDPPAGGGPLPGTFRSYVAVDDRFRPKATPPKRPEDRDPRDRTGKLHDFVVEAGLRPTVGVFTRAQPAEDSAAAKLARALDPAVQKARAGRLGAFVVFLTLDAEWPADARRTPDGVGFVRDQEADKVRALAAQLKTSQVPFGLAANKSPEADAWGLGPDVETAVVLLHRARVVADWKFKAGEPPTDEAIQQVVQRAEEVALGKKK